LAPPYQVHFTGPGNDFGGSLGFLLTQDLGTTGEIDLVPGPGTGWETLGGSHWLSFTDPANPPFVTGTAEGSAPIPEPASLLMLGAGCGCIVLRRRAAQKRS
jgi:hypothetical protein